MLSPTPSGCHGTAAGGVIQITICEMRVLGKAQCFQWVDFSLEQPSADFPRRFPNQKQWALAALGLRELTMQPGP
jgi:hypothetical protein